MKKITVFLIVFFVLFITQVLTPAAVFAGSCSWSSDSCGLDGPGSTQGTGYPAECGVSGCAPGQTESCTSYDYPGGYPDPYGGTCYTDSGGQTCTCSGPVAPTCPVPSQAHTDQCDAGYTGSLTYDCFGNYESGSCTAVPLPVCASWAGQTYTTAANSCGMTNSCTFDCGGANCDATAAAGPPPDSACPAATPTCADSGQQGTYPACYTPASPTCADQGQLGTYPACYDASSCTADSSCSASTCSGNTCSDSCGNSYAGTQSCSAPPTPSVSCAPSTQSIATGGTASFTATPSGSATSPYNWYDALNTFLGSGTTFSKLYSTAGSYAVHVTASSGAVTSADCQVTVGSACGTPALTLTASPTRVHPGNTTTLTLSGTGVTAGNCTITGGTVTPATAIASSCVVAGTFTTGPITTQTKYTATCPDSGASATVSVIVNLIPVFQEF